MSRAEITRGDDMAFTRISNADLNSRGATTLADQPNMSAALLKEEFDAPAKQVVAPKVNNLMDELEASTAAASLGATAPTGRSGGTVQEVMNDISSDLATVEAGMGQAIADAHTHDNKALLDSYNQSNSDLSDAVAKKHDHANKTVLDKFGESSGQPTYDGNPIGGTADAYKTVTVGATDIVASGEDKLTLIAGNNVTLSADPSAKSVTINSTGGGGGGGAVNNAYKNVTVGSTTLTASGEDTLILEAGSNVTLTSDPSTKKVTIAAAGGGGGAGDAYKTVKVGSTNIVASGEDTIEFVAGSNITLTPDASNKRVTITASSNETEVIDSSLSLRARVKLNTAISQNDLLIVNDKTWSGLTSYYGYDVWTDGDDIYHSTSSNGTYVLDKSTGTWSTKTWNGFNQIVGDHVWTDGENIYYSNSSDQYVLNKSTDTWTAKTWNGLSGNLNGRYIWTYGGEIYYLYTTNSYVLDKSTSTWSPKTWTGLSTSGLYGLYASGIWTDGEDIYYSYYGGTYNDQFVFDKSTGTWSAMSWTGFQNLVGLYIWTDGKDVYHTQSGTTYVLNKTTKTWVSKTIYGITSAIHGDFQWTDGDNIYFSLGETQKKLDGAVAELVWTGTASSTGIKKQQLLTNESATDVDGTAYMEQSVTLSTSAATTVTFTNAIIADGKMFTLATSLWNLVPDDIVTTSGVCTITLPKWGTAETIGVRLYVR